MVPSAHPGCRGVAAKLPKKQPHAHPALVGFGYRRCIHNDAERQHAGRGRWCAVRTIPPRLGYIFFILPEPARLNGKTFPAVSLPSAAARTCADHASSAARFSSAQSCL